MSSADVIEPNMLVIKSTLQKKLRATYKIEGHEGLYLQTRADGTGSWVIRYRVGGSQREKTLHNDAGRAKFADISKAKDEWRTAAKVHGRDIQAEREAEVKAKAARISFGRLFGDWLERHAKVKKKSWLADELLWNRHIKKRMEHLPASSIKRSDLAAILDEIAVKATPIQANKAQAVVSAVFAWAVNQGRLEATPAYRMPKRGEERPRERVLTDDEIRALWKATENSGTVGDALRFGLITGQRRSEVAEMPASELDLNSADPAWTIPSKRTKNKVIHRVPLTVDAVAMLQSRLKQGGSFVFAGRADSATGAIAPDAVTRFIWKLGIGHPKITVHDLRRTVGTRMAAMGVPREVRARVLNHVSGARASVTDAVYNQHEGNEDKRRALRLWSLHLRMIISGRKPHRLAWHG